MAMTERRPQLEKKRHQGSAFMSLIFFPMVVLLSGSSRTMTGLSSSALLPPEARRTPVRHSRIVISQRNMLQQIKRIETEELAMGRNGTAVCRKNRVDTTADVATGDKKVQTKNVLEVKPMASHLPSSATTPPQGMPEFLPFKNELFERRLKTCGTSDAFGNREYPVGNGKALQHAYVLMPGSLDHTYLNKLRHIAGILPHIIEKNVTYAVLRHTDYFEFIPLEELNSGSRASIQYSESELVGLTEVVLTTFAAAIIMWLIVVTMSIKKLFPRHVGRNVYIHIVVAVVLFASTDVQSLPEIYPLTLRESYHTLFNMMHEYLEDNTALERGHYILPPQMKEEDMRNPNILTRWVSVEVTGDVAGPVAVLYFRADTIYLVGFMNSEGTLYCTADATEIFPVPGCTPLGFTSNYNALTERPSKYLDLSLFMQEALLGMRGAKEAANVLTMYGVTIFEESAVRNAMLAYSIMIAEAMRFKPISDLVKENWDQSTVLPKELCNLPFVWQDASKLWCRGEVITENKPEWEIAVSRMDKANIRNEQDLDRVLDLVKYEKVCKDLRKKKNESPPAPVGEEEHSLPPPSGP